MDAVTASCTGPASAASAGIAQKTVFRMIIGGSTGFSRMIALPRPAPPILASAVAVVWVNSSMFARVPGPADRDATDETISAYGTSTTALTAATTGTVACPPQVIMFRFGASRLRSRFTGGHTYGPTAAGVRSIARMPAAAYRGAFCACAFALVASNTMSGTGSRASSQSTPPALAASPCCRALARPSEPGSMPTMYRGSTSPPERSSFIIRSVPMFPDPTIAAVTSRTASPQAGQAVACAGTPVLGGHGGDGEQRSSGLGHGVAGLHRN